MVFTETTRQRGTLNKVFNKAEFKSFILRLDLTTFHEVRNLTLCARNNPLSALSQITKKNMRKIIT